MAVATLLALQLGYGAASAQLIPDRRKDQFLTEPAYLIIPFPYSLPGIGSGIAYTGLLANIAETNADAFGILITGDAEGSLIALEDVHVIPQTLILEYQRLQLNRAVITLHKERGMDSDKDEFNLIELNEVDQTSARAILSFFDRRFELFAGFLTEETGITKIRDSDGNIEFPLTETLKNEDETRFAGIVLDITDDRQDPRKGIRIEVQRSHTPPDTDTETDFLVWDYSASIYLPVGRLSTLLLNYFQSDAQVTRKGETDPSVIAADFNLPCAADVSTCTDTEQKLIDRFVAARKYGTASSLGGQNRLRSFPDGRYQGAHTIFYAVEFRWNLTEEVTPFNYFIWKDVRTGVQLALFYETGSVADRRPDLGDTFRSSYGLGVRLISGSGFVYRADYANGDEGGNLVVIFGYPF